MEQQSLFPVIEALNGALFTLRDINLIVFENGRYADLLNQVLFIRYHLTEAIELAQKSSL